MAELEKLDPETVKTARSLMAFGALGRARGMATAANTGGMWRGAKPQAAKTTAVVNDAKQGFAASAADDKVDSKSIPDPAAFGEGDTPADAKAATVAKSNDEKATTNAAVQSPPAPGSTTMVSAHVNPLLVAGVPLAAACGADGRLLVDFAGGGGLALSRKRFETRESFLS